MFGHRSEEEGGFHNGKFACGKHKAERSLYCTGKRGSQETAENKVTPVCDSLTGPDSQSRKSWNNSALLLFDVCLVTAVDPGTVISN